MSKLRLHVWSTVHPASSSHAAGTTAALAGDEVAENQLMYVVLGTVLGVVVLVAVVCIAMCTWRHQQQPRRAVGMSIVYLFLTYFPAIFTIFPSLHLQWCCQGLMVRGQGHLLSFCSCSRVYYRATVSAHLSLAVLLVFTDTYIVL